LDLKGLFPGESFVRNIGFDGGGTHCAEIENEELINSPLTESYRKIKEIQVKVDPVMYGYLRDYYKYTLNSWRNPFIEFVFSILRGILPKTILDLIRKRRRA
jgi:hypothetical protein